MKIKRLQNSVVVLLFILCFSSAAFAAGVIDLPQTGQTTCYNESGVIVACAGTGQDGDWLAGVAWPKPRFVAGTGTEADCMIDKLTGLMWPKNGNQGYMSWTGALDIANNFTLCGHDDWRLPNVVELRSLVNDEEPNKVTWLNTQGFNNVQSWYYWSSSTHAAWTGDAWYVDMVDGVVDYGNGRHKDDDNYVWPVRAGQSGLGTSAVDLPRTGQTATYYAGDDGAVQAGVAWPTPRFSVSGECVTDNLTGLMWTKDAAFDHQDWYYALNSANDLSLCGFTDWRLPNVNELRSVVDYSNFYPALPDPLPFTHVQLDDYYWSSSTYSSNTDDAWLVDMVSGYVVDFNGYKGFRSYVWPVRAGQFGALIISPSKLTAKATSSSKIVLGWKDNSDNETSFKIYRKAGAGAFTLLKSLPANTETYADLTASGNDTATSYSYYVKACNAVGCSANTPAAVVPFKPAKLIGSKITNGAKLTWTDKSANEKGFQIYRKGGSCTSTNPLTLIKTTAANVATFSNTGLAAGTYSYKIRAFSQSAASPSSFGYSTFSNCATVTVP